MPLLPEDIFHTIQEFHNQKAPINDEAIDALIGYGPEDVIQEPQESILARRYGLEQFTYEGTPYSFTRYFLHKIPITSDDVLYDLGSGYGKVVIYAAITTPARVIGIEIVPERVIKSQEIVQRLQLQNADFTRANICDQDITDGTVFFLFNPFSDYAFWSTMDKLQDISQNHPITVVTWGGGLTEHFNEQSWLVPLTGKREGFTPNISWVKIYKSQ